MRKRIARIYHHAKQPFDRLWKWATGHPKRWRALKGWAGRHRQQARENHRINRAKWWAKKRSIYARKWKRAKRHLRETGQVPGFETWMLNGHSNNITDAVRAEIAIAVVKYNCAVSSTYRAYVIPQSNPNSYHGPNVSPGKAFDAVGARMTEWQHDVFARRRGDSACLELFGPDNSTNLKYGNQLALGEGTFLENLHDSHTHEACQ